MPLALSSVVSLTDAQMLAKHMLSNCLPPNSIDAAWLSGSMVEGFAHGSSDIDVFVATKRIREEFSVTRRHAGFAVYAFIDQGSRYDLEYWELGTIEALASKLRSIRFLGSDANLSQFLSPTEVSFAHRLLVAVPLVHPEIVASLRASIDAPMLVRYLYEAALHRYDDAFDDAVGMLRANQLECAALRARSAVGYAVDLQIHALGSTNPQEKFRPEKFRRLALQFPDAQHLMERYWLVEAGVPRDALLIEEYVQTTLVFAEYLSAGVQDSVAEAKRGGNEGGDSELISTIPEVLRSSPPTAR